MLTIIKFYWVIYITDTGSRYLVHISSFNLHTPSGGRDYYYLPFTDEQIEARED